MIRPRGRRSEKKQLINFLNHYVYAEGSKTEPLYVENIKNVLQKDGKYKNSNINIEAVENSGGRNTLNLLAFAEKDINNKLVKNEIVKYVWIFYDKDSFPKDDFDNTLTSIISKNKMKNDDGDPCDENGIAWRACWSNECFEIWALLHFSYVDSAISRKNGQKSNNIINKINECLKTKGTNERYEKNLKNLYDLLTTHGDVKNAIKHAMTLEKDHKTNNPSTGIYQFLVYFKKYLGIE